MTNLALPRPDNLRVPLGSRAHLVESDVYHICERLREIDPNLYLYALDPPVEFGDKTYRWSVNEFCGDGVERLVARYEELDARIIENILYLAHVPFEKRLAEAERIEAQNEADNKQAELEELYERFGGPMRHQLFHDGFADSPTSYRKIPKRRYRPCS